MLERLDKRPIADWQGAPVGSSEGENLRHYCRNLQCRAKLSTPVANAREAFCCRGCYASFFRTRCRVCERPIEQPARGTRLICNRAKCKSAWRAGLSFGRCHTLNRAESISKTPVNSGSKVGADDDRARSWRVVAAGTPLSASQYHCAIVEAADAVAIADRINAAHWRTAKTHLNANPISPRRGAADAERISSDEIGGEMRAGAAFAKEAPALEQAKGGFDAWSK